MSSQCPMTTVCGDHLKEFLECQRVTRHRQLLEERKYTYIYIHSQCSVIIGVAHLQGEGRAVIFAHEVTKT